MYQLTFQPFVGKDYDNGGVFNKKVMVLGDSHYGTTLSSDITQKVMDWYLDSNVEREEWMNTYLKFERSLVGHQTTQDESAKIWNSVLFYNYLQVLLSGPRESGTAEEYKNSSKAFFEVLDKYQPDILIVWGKQLWKNLPWQAWIEKDAVNVDNYAIDNGTYTLNGGHVVKVFCVYHPSVGYSWDYWYKVITRVGGIENNLRM